MVDVQVGPGKTATLTCQMTGVTGAALTVKWFKTDTDEVTTDDTGLTMSTSGKCYKDLVRITVSLLIVVITKHLTTKSISDFSITLKSNVSDSVDGSGNQVATLQITSDQITVDRSFTCEVQSTTESTVSRTDATVNKYGMLLQALNLSTWSL